MFNAFTKHVSVTEDIISKKKKQKNCPEGSTRHTRHHQIDTAHVLPHPVFGFSGCQLGTQY